MSELMRYTPDEALALAGRVEADYHAGLLIDQGLTFQQEDLKFRDPAGQYWLVSIPGLCWYVYQGGQWRTAGGPPAAAFLEGSAALTVSRAPRLAQSFAISRPTGGPAGALPAWVAALRQAYERGELHSGEVEARLTQAYLLDASGQLWTVGYRSGDWYCLQGNQWVRMPQFSSRTAAHRQSPFAHLDRLNPPPELVADEWQPPPGGPTGNQPQTRPAGMLGLSRAVQRLTGRITAAPYAPPADTAPATSAQPQAPAVARPAPLPRPPASLFPARRPGRWKVYGLRACLAVIAAAGLAGVCLVGVAYLALGDVTVILPASFPLPQVGSRPTAVPAATPGGLPSFSPSPPAAAAPVTATPWVGPTFVPSSIPSGPVWTAFGGQWSGPDPSGLISGESASGDGLYLADFSAADFSFRAQARADTREASLAFRMQDSQNGYLLIFVPTEARGGVPGLYLMKEVQGQYILLDGTNSITPKTGEWVDLAVSAIGQHLEGRLNGRVALEFDDRQPPFFTQGRLGLRIFGEGNAPCQALFRQIQFP